MKKILMICMVLTMAMGIFAGCGGDSKAPAEKKDTGKKIVLGLDDNFPPMGFVDESNKIVGFDIDVAKEAAKRMGGEVEFKPIDWASKEAELKSGRVDMLWNGLDITPKRKENILFSDPYMNNRFIIFRAEGHNEDIKDEASLAGKVVATQSGGGTIEEYLDGKPELTGSFKEFKKYQDYLAAFMDLENGRIDAVVCDEIIGRYYMSKHPNKLAAVDVTVGPAAQFGVGFRKDDQALRDKVQKALDEMRQDGTLAKISQKWFAADITKLTK
ncbi:MAG: amino acid ABC transporter substrate-binding protein [Schwartzia sp. (in: firmicutes)]